MAAALLIAFCLVFSLLHRTYSAPAQITIQEETAVIDVTTIQGMGTVNDSHLVTSSSNNSTKVSGSESNDVAQKTFAGAADVVEKGDQSSMNTKNDAVVMDARIAGAKSNVMTLTDDVITDALFTNIDTIQDNLEVCEEGLRQQLRRHSSHGRFIQDRAEEDDDFPTDRVGLPSSRKDQDKSRDSNQNIQVEAADEGDEDKDSDDDDEIDNNNETDNDDEDESHSSETDTPPGSLQGKARQRRAVAGEHPGGQLSRRADILAQKVVQRLSDRLDYLRSSLFQCHLLYKHLGML